MIKKYTNYKDSNNLIDRAGYYIYLNSKIKNKNINLIKEFIKIYEEKKSLMINYILFIEIYEFINFLIFIIQIKQIMLNKINKYPREYYIKDKNRLLKIKSLDVIRENKKDFCNYEVIINDIIKSSKKYNNNMYKYPIKEDIYEYYNSDNFNKILNFIYGDIYIKDINEDEVIDNQINKYTLYTISNEGFNYCDDEIKDLINKILSNIGVIKYFKFDIRVISIYHINIVYIMKEINEFYINFRKLLYLLTFNGFIDYKSYMITNKKKLNLLELLIDILYRDMCICNEYIRDINFYIFNKKNKKLIFINDFMDKYKTFEKFIKIDENYIKILNSEIIKFIHADIMNIKNKFNTYSKLILENYKLEYEKIFNFKSLVLLDMSNKELKEYFNINDDTIIENLKYDCNIVSEKYTRFLYKFLKENIHFVDIKDIDDGSVIYYLFMIMKTFVKLKYINYLIKNYKPIDKIIFDYLFKNRIEYIDNEKFNIILFKILIFIKIYKLYKEIDNLNDDTLYKYFNTINKIFFNNETIFDLKETKDKLINLKDELIKFNYKDHSKYVEKIISDL